MLKEGALAPDIELLDQHEKKFSLKSKKKVPIHQIMEKFGITTVLVQQRM
jgi:hypothetical protein